MKKIFPLIVLIVVIAVSSCKKKETTTPTTTTTTTNPPPSTSDYYKIGTTTYSPDKSLTSGLVDPSDDVLTISTQPVSNSLIQIYAFDTLYDMNGQLTVSTNYGFIQAVTTWPSPSFSKGSFELVENLSLPNEIVWVPTSGTLSVTKNTNGTFTATFSNVPVKDQNGTATSTASGMITY